MVDATAVSADCLAFFTAVDPRGSRTFDPIIAVVSCWVAVVSVAPDRLAHLDCASAA